MKATRLRCAAVRARLALSCMGVLCVDAAQNRTEIDENEQSPLGPPDADDVVAELAAERAARDLDLGFREAIDLQNLVDVEADDLVLGPHDEQDSPPLGDVGRGDAQPALQVDDRDEQAAHADDAHDLARRARYFRHRRKLQDLPDLADGNGVGIGAEAEREVLDARTSKLETAAWLHVRIARDKV